ncbi:NAD/NADP-dependent octopine/nopaline dehydrogenase family protein [Ancylobacter sp. SL191]|uniref:NAD/NADP-dependent octopine/nopaline dehydrogenase family protein n=1 Tax=Ancylobacter sp. SL191 TaxID=2995166 RepID=UPI00226F8CC2|nr:NAD/NADP-dependent octopine/nopaline dehydrogenase family protein [Ancylobacter sp. SL191]WAC28481.1 NAD/NADP octopine/nopaline dehydrogenase family protein [Ancylobacter sp. SL191]
MRVSILGAGSIAFGVAGFLAAASHEPVLWSPSGRATQALAAGAPLKAFGALDYEGPVATAASAGEAVATSDVLFLALPGYGHRAALDAVIPHIRPGQPIIISSHSSFGALYLARALATRGVSAPIIVWGTTLLTARVQSPDTVKVNTVRQKIDVATLPKEAIEEGHALCTTLFGDRFVRRDGLLAIALSNLNPQNHLGIALLNLTRMEKGEVWGQGEHVTPAVGRVIEALDAERLAIAESFGLSVRTVREHFSLSFHVPMASVSEMNQQMHAEGRGGFGPTSFDSRYIFEDVPFGLVPTVLLGQLTGRPATLHAAGVALLSAAAGRDLAADNNLLPALGLDTLSVDALAALCATGYPVA